MTTRSRARLNRVRALAGISQPGLAAHRRTVYNPDDDPRTPLNAYVLDALRGAGLDASVPAAA